MFYVTTLLKLASFLLFTNSVIGEGLLRNDEEQSSRSLIVGGEVVNSTDKYPFFAQIVGLRSRLNEFGNATEQVQFSCGGVLIAKDVVLTKSDCTYRAGSETLGIKIILGYIEAANKVDRTILNATNWIYDDSPEDAGEERTPGLIFLAEDADAYGFDPINVKAGNKYPQLNQELTIMGFGLTDEDYYNEGNSDFLEEVNVVVNSLAQCNAIFSDDVLIAGKQFCAGGLGKGACVGDSGAPAIDADGDVVGLVAFGDGNCGAFPTVFIRVGGFHGFLKSNVCGRPGIDDPEWCSREPSDEEPPPPPSIPMGFCFAGSSSVQVEHEDGQVENMFMKDLSIGDKVNIGEGIYEPIYSFGHYSPSMKADVLQIKTDARTELRLSPNHLILTASRGTLPASHLKVGDELLTGTEFSIEHVKSIDVVRSTGMFAPFTPSGKIVVDGILASSYIAFEDTEGFEIFSGFKISHQWMAHTGSLPHRVMCYYMRSKFCEAEEYTSEGISTGVYSSLLFFQKLFDFSNHSGFFVRYLLTGLLMTVLLLSSFVELTITNPSTSLVSILVLFSLIGVIRRGNTGFRLKLKSA
mmetsp:Transcript_4173/g.5991  ORF Transcript_4173/g.5991 Transcript_4173/m.5991 type:complete len:580 (+) Transcript_4173:147-1886(+)